MRIESSVTSITWIPSEAIKGMPKLPFELGLTHYDDPPPDRIDDLAALRDSRLLPRGERAARLHRGARQQDRQLRATAGAA